MLAFIPSLIRSSFLAPIFWPAYVAIVDPSASNGHAKKIVIFEAAVTDATTTDPRPFTAA